MFPDSNTEPRCSDSSCKVCTLHSCSLVVAIVGRSSHLLPSCFVLPVGYQSYCTLSDDCLLQFANCLSKLEALWWNCVCVVAFQSPVLTLFIVFVSYHIIPCMPCVLHPHHCASVLAVGPPRVTSGDSSEAFVADPHGVTLRLLHRYSRAPAFALNLGVANVDTSVEFYSAAFAMGEGWNPVSHDSSQCGGGVSLRFPPGVCGGQGRSSDCQTQSGEKPHLADSGTSLSSCVQGCVWSFLCSCSEEQGFASGGACPHSSHLTSPPVPPPLVWPLQHWCSSLC